jgi:hypothetical protein
VFRHIFIYHDFWDLFSQFNPICLGHHLEIQEQIAQTQTEHAASTAATATAAATAALNCRPQ